jgi:hypothetical protein
MQPLQTARGGEREIVDRFLAIPDDELHIADCFVADWQVRLRSTCLKTIELYSQRLRARNPITPESGARLTLSLVETRALGWPQTKPDSDARSLNLDFERLVRTSGLKGVYLNAVEPCAFFDPVRQMGVEVVASVDDLPPWHAGAPFRIPLHLAAVSRGWGLVHAASLAVADEGVLIVGPGKAGKSGTTLAGISAGLTTTGDDYVLVCPGASPTARRVYNLLKQDRHGLARIDGLVEATAHLDTNWQDKLELDPEELFPGCMVEHIRLRAIVAPKIVHASKTQFVSVSPQSVFQQFWPSLWAQLPVAQAQGFKFAASLMRSLPTFTMLLSDDPAEIGESIRHFIRGVRK